ncbi:MAG: NAD-dependent epimerase/dehydratase family protein [Chloroflexi bacterium]|nr:NAD-dependent epimerase/dehydratase family protein [Chloroflexota bacterium]
MVRALVTGGAGFIGSNLTERLLADGWDVTAVDAFTDYYPRPYKERNVAGLREHARYQLLEADLLDLDLPRLLEGVDVVFHHAAQAGVRASWGRSFDIYTHNNIQSTQRLLEAAKDAHLRKFVYASSSSVYGDAESFPTPETVRPQPVSPYGVTKLAAEHLCVLYQRNFGVPTVSLRYFTVYGPRQRPDMAFHIFLRALLTGAPIHVFGDGGQTRDFTFVGDVVQANMLAAEHGRPGGVYNIGGGSQIGLLEVVRMLERITGRRADLHFEDRQKGDARHTAADTSQAKADLGYQPAVDLESGLTREATWMRGMVDAGALV